MLPVGMVEHDPGLKTVGYGSPWDPDIVGSPDLPVRVRTEVTARLSEELARFGAVGEVDFDSSEVALLHPTGVRRVSVVDWLPHWEQLDDSTRRLRISQLARSLARPTSLPAQRPPSLGETLRPWLLAGAAGAIAIAGAVWAINRRRSDAPEPPPRSRSPALAAGAADVAPDRSRSSLVCAATRARVVRGATVSIADAEGWVVEYMAFRVQEGAAPLHQSPALATYFEAPSSPTGSRYVWREEPELATTPTSEDRVLVRPEVITGSTPPGYQGVRVTFFGALVDAYFRPTTRGAYFHLASALTDTLGATHAALYARCADGATHHLGSWFRGHSHEDAVASLLYTLGTFADPPHLAEPYLRPLGAAELDRAFAFASIARVTSALDRPLVASLMGREGGMVMGRPGEAVTLTFPFEDGNRASRSSREIARLTNIGGL